MIVLITVSHQKFKEKIGCQGLESLIFQKTGDLITAAMNQLLKIDLKTCLQSFVDLNRALSMSGNLCQGLMS